MPRIEGANLAEHHELVRGRILDGFGIEMQANGFAATAVSRVAKHAGVARPTVYNYFSDKNELLLGYVQRTVDEFIGRVSREIEDLPSAADRLAVVVRGQIESFQLKPGSGTASGMLDGGSLAPDVRDALLNRLRGLHSLVRGVLTYGIETGEFLATDDVQAHVEIIGSIIRSQRMPVGEGRRSVNDAVDLIMPFVITAIRA